MSCCGQGRQALRSSMKRQSPPEPAVASPPQQMAIAYRGDRSLLVRGPVTGTAYLFGPTGEPFLMDARDARMLLDTGQFEPR